MKNNFKKIIAVCLSASLAIQSLGMQTHAQTTSSLVVISEVKETSIVTSGLTYEKKSKLTNLGWVDIYVIKMDLQNENVDMDVIRSMDEWGDKEALTTLMDKNESIAAINATFFNTTSNPTESIGPEYEGDQFSYLQHNYNTSTYGAASLMVTEDKEVDFGFFGAQISFKNDKGNSIYISSINGLTSFTNPVVINTNAMSTTAQVESKGNFYKMVIENGLVKEYVNPKTPATIPVDGYVVTLDASTALNYTGLFPVGTPVVLEVNSLTTDKLYDMIISGGGRILKEGKVVQEGMIIEPDKRHPRTALGITADENYLIAMVVDGRGSSIGATHNELAMYLQEYDVKNGIYMDGGGSSTLATRTLGTDEIAIDNVPSDGSQRRVVNGLGFISTAPLGKLTELKIIPNETRVFKSMPITFEVIGYDEYYNPIELDPSNLIWSTQTIKGSWNGLIFTPSNSGQGTVTCYYDEMSASVPITVMDSYVDLDAEKDIYYVDAGKSVNIKVLGTDPEGYKGQVNPSNINWQIDNSALGFIQNGTFFAGSQNGIAKVTFSSGDNTSVTYVAVGTQLQAGTSFETANVTAVTYPDTAIGSSQLSTAIAFDGLSSVQLNYSFPISDETQAVYSVLEGISFDQNVRKFGLNVYGNNSNLLLKAKLVDANNDSYNVTLSKGIDFTGWKYLEADLPEGIAYPVQFERVYIASLKNTEPLNGTIYFDLLATKIIYDTSNLKFNLDIPVQDPLRLQNAAEYEYKISVFGSTSGKNRLLDEIVLDKAISTMDDANLAVFAGLSEVNVKEILTENIIWSNTYKTNMYKDIKIINLATNSGGLIDSDYTQWNKLQTELKSTSQNNIILIGNKNPTLDNSFIDQREADLLHDVLSDYQKQTGKNIYYINASGYSFGVDFYEGIRYIDINGLWYKLNNGKIDLNNSFYMLDFYLVDGNLYYNYENIYPVVEIK